MILIRLSNGCFVLQFACMLELEEALKRILAALPGQKKETLKLEAAHRRFLAEEIVASTALPPFDNSAMDGYALRATDTAGANPGEPVRLRQVARIPAGSSFSGVVRPGECVRLFTGSPIPAGADAVVMQEDTRLAPEELESVHVLVEAAPGENIRSQGTDVAKGNVVLRAGEELTTSRLSLLAGLGCERVCVGQQPRVGILATGSELRDPGQELAPGQIYESNRLTLSILLRQLGIEGKVFPIVRDTLAETRTALQEAFKICDVLVSSGGVSVGEMDFVKTAFEENGGLMEFWKVAIKPGRPFVFGRLGEKVLFGVPGNPVSAFVTFLLLVRPALLRWQGAIETSLRCSFGVLGETLSNPGNRRHLFRVRFDAEGIVYSAGAQGSHMLSSLAAAAGLLDMGAGMTLEQGREVKVLRWE